MRESNSRLVEVNRAVRVISQAEYDRRALDCTSALPLLNTLLSLSYQVTISPTVRSMLVIDGGLERIVHILVNCRKLDPLSIRKRHTALECLYNICTRGTEFIRVRMVETGVADLALATVSSFNVNNSYSTLEEQSQIESTCISRQRSTFIKRTPQMQKPKTASNLTGTMNTFLQNILDDKLFGQEQHVCLALRMIAFLTKHFSIRKVLHSKYDHSLFAVVERFTHTDYTDEIKTWARAILLHFCKREGLTDGLRRCANLECDKWESHPREFLKCNNCRRVRYCSQSCQQNAWKGGHEFWCCIRMNSEGFLIKY
ncbi:uncharacterized protein BX663DRAFT_478861 [Cokeromyces recurvatus]|uniref:uncharacterized protein n=1 Tax=Cokeromyces recurvatus TaxID=90255 RepID=UPI002220893C|nr:uncharacterized protein BX663DRAFT_478861 [Cokeromyces recurvatus]KAI7899276.1 hypothetical protein BX663DRAFT_478861 [Cokeromyces recurvatus]